MMSMTGLDMDIFRATRHLTTLLNEACNHWNYLCPYLVELDVAANRALECYNKDYPNDVDAIIIEDRESAVRPRRNCDRFSSVKEAALAFASEVKDKPHPCPDFTFSAWLFAPAKEGVEE